MSRVNICHRWKELMLFVAILAAVYMFLTLYEMGTSKKESKLRFIIDTNGSCEQLFLNSAAADFAMSPTFNRLKSVFESEMAKAIGAGGFEGYSAQLKEEYLTLHYLASRSNVKNICETGFNLGHSSFNFLTANDRTIVHSFDLGNHGYARIMSEFVKKTFPLRFFIHFGDSVNTIPQFIQANSTFLCDLMLVDGGHLYNVALADLKNFAKIANLNENIIVFDDYPTDWGQSFGKAWEEMIQDKTIEELMRCSFRSVVGLQRGFVIGKVLKRP